MIDCGHVFCVECLQDFYNNAINEGDLASVRCLEPDCAKKRAEAQTSTMKNRRLKIQLSPSELLQIPLEHDVVSRYVKLKHKAELESDKNTIYCPRKWCQGAARSKKHRKPDGFEDSESSDDESDDDTSGAGNFAAGKDLLAVCEDCSFAFCSRCYQGWHGEFTTCTPKTNTGELTEEDKKSLEYLKAHSTPCPTCAAPCQKTHGCNHMICFKCRSHFCYLCSAWLSPTNPYQHYTEEKTWCYMRLWELEEGDGDGVVPGGGRPVEIPDEEEELEEVPVEVANEAAAAPAVEFPEIVVQEPPPAPRDELEREGPLVLRINQVPQPVLVAPAVRDPPAANQQNRGPQHQAAQNVRRQPGIPIGGRRAGRPHNRQRDREDLERQRAAANQEAAQQAWVQMFVRMALNDEEDQLDSDDEDDDGAAWEIPVR
jgi:E3 ubiquitin-protein ligase RNF14